VLPATAAIIGYGRFGRFLATMLAADFELRVHDVDTAAVATARADGRRTVGLDEALRAGAVLYCVPISDFERTFAHHAPRLTADGRPHTVVDVLSVKTLPRHVFEQHLPPSCSALLTHPLFGPDSAQPGDLAGHRIMLDSLRMTAPVFDAWRQLFERKGLAVLVMSSEEHDRLAAASQGVTHFVGRTLERFGFAPTPVDTLGATKLHEITDQVCHDTWQLFVDLETQNPHTAEMRVRLASAQNAVFDALLPDRIVTDRLVVGIQGGPGSFNEEAARHYMARTPDEPYDLVYLHTTGSVLRALEAGAVDRGLFAIHSAHGGMVGESIHAMAERRFAIADEFEIRIAHALMVAPDADMGRVDTIMTHPQVLSQCRTTLARDYPRLRLTSGEGDLIDHAKVAELLGKGELPPTTATMGSSVLAELYGLRVVARDLQDVADNLTSFLWVRRPR
jgi:prephenate dehydrogenase